MRGRKTDLAAEIVDPSILVRLGRQDKKAEQDQRYLHPARHARTWHHTALSPAAEPKLKHKSDVG